MYLSANLDFCESVAGMGLTKKRRTSRKKKQGRNGRVHHARHMVGSGAEHTHVTHRPVQSRLLQKKSRVEGKRERKKMGDLAAP